MIYKKKTQNIIYIVLGVFLLSVILLIGRSVRLQQNKVLCSALADEKLSYEQFELAVCDVTEGKALTAVLIRCTNNRGEYIVGCRMIEDNQKF